MHLGLELAAGEEFAYGKLLPGEIEVSGFIGGERVVPFASVTKLAAALAAMVAIEEGSLALDSGVGNFRLCIANLLSHSSGLETGNSSDPRLAKAGEVEPVFAPGTRRVYSNFGFELVAQAIEESSGIDFSTYLAEAVLEPAGARSATIDSHALGSPGTRGAAFGLLGTLADMVALVRALWAPGVVSQESLEMIRRPFLPDLPGVLPGYGRMEHNTWGLGAEVKGSKAPHWTAPSSSPATFGHFGQSGTFIWLDPELHRFAAYIGASAFGAWSRDRWPNINEEVIQTS